MVDEITALHTNGTWDLVPLSSDKIIMDCHWIYTIIIGFDGQVPWFKACLETKDYAQINGLTMVAFSLQLPRLHLFKCFSPCMLCSIRLPAVGY